MWLENKSLELLRHFPIHFHTSCGGLPERGYKAMPVKTVCLSEPVRETERGFRVAQREHCQECAYVSLCS